MTATTFMLAFITFVSPSLVALVRRRRWSHEAIVIAAAIMSCAGFVLGQWFDGALTWPLPDTFWLGLAGAFGLNQAGYQVMRAAAPSALASIERVGDPDPGGEE